MSILLYSYISIIIDNTMELNLEEFIKNGRSNMDDSMDHLKKELTKIGFNFWGLGDGK